MKRIILAALLTVCTVFPAMAADGVINVQSTFTAKETADRLESVLHDKGMQHF